MLYAEEVDALAEATAVDVTEEGRVELWQFCRAATGLDGEALSSVLSNLDKEDADMLSALRATCATWEPNKVAKVVRALLRWLHCLVQAVEWVVVLVLLLLLLLPVLLPEKEHVIDHDRMRRVRFRAPLRRRTQSRLACRWIQYGLG